MAKKIIHVARNAIKSNIKNNTTNPTIIVRERGKSIRYNSVEILGPSKIVEGALGCGARVWIETNSEVKGH